MMAHLAGNDWIAAVGFVLLVIGVAMVSLPAALIVAGLGLLVLGLLGATH
jgi:hypothetical protein